MILYRDYIIKLDYDPATDILQVDYPDLQSAQLSEVRHSLTLLVEAIRNYDVKKLLLDASSTSINVSHEESKELTLKLAADLASTRIKKLARVQPINMRDEVRAQENIKNLHKSGLLPYQLQTFATKYEALRWLLED
jgi:hypothetical protein